MAILHGRHSPELTAATLLRHSRLALDWVHQRTALDAIQAATINAADLLGWPDKIGALETGHYADLIAVNGDPTTDVRVLESVKFVMKGGAIVRNDFAAKGAGN